MNFIDIFILIILLIGGLNGLRQGLIKAFANLIGWVFAFIVAAKYTPVLAPAMIMFSADPVVQKIVAFAFIVLSILVMTWIVTYVLNRILKTLKLGPLNRLAGGAFGSLKGLFIVLITLQGIGPWVESSPYWKQSKWVHALLPYAPWATQMSKDVAGEALQHIKPESTKKTPELPSVHHSNSETEDSTKNPFY
ncbi:MULTISPECIES: CvpA family protein [unclassified Acinetobacter]|uniref:CvpA family protein n=1 Tax=unclassified Acinetobacter TaxID=196816 RepID=UPI0029342AF7|nr:MULTISPECIES: CvpA family protein [unclassified Acinetobacter]WOE31716.1 CvpA family protein [Acinetobacter sp. SAAs470]WOE37183.1 CvpA family protein [Acinetobacter sp. SAAs474]